MMNIQNAIKDANQELKRNNIKSFILDSEILMSKTLNKDRKYILLNENKKLLKEELINFKRLIEQRSQGKPVAY